MTETKPRRHADLKLLDYLILAQGNKEDLYGYHLQEVYELAGKKLKLGAHYKKLGKLADYGYLNRSETKVCSNTGPERRMYSILPQGKDVLTDAVPIIGRILLGAGNVDTENRTDAKKSVIAADLSLMDLVVISWVNRSTERYAYQLHDEYNIVGKTYNSGSVHDKFNKLNGHGLLVRGQEKEYSPLGPDRWMHETTPNGQEILIESAPLLGRVILGATMPSALPDCPAANFRSTF